MRGDSQVELRGAVLVGRRVVPRDDAKSVGPDAGVGELVTVEGLLLRIDSRGMTVEGPRPNVVHTVSWQRVRSVDAGKSAIFEDASPARSIQVELDDRRVQFLVPVEALGDDQLRVLDEIVSEHLRVQSRGHPGGHVRGRRETDNEILGAIDRTPTPPSAPAPARQLARFAAPGGRPAVKAPKLRFPVGGGSSRHGLPPPPPGSNVVMPPGPSDAGADAASRAGADAASEAGADAASADRFGIHADLLIPLAVPAARRVHAPNRPAFDSSAFDSSSFDAASRRVAPKLPPPPPGGSGSQLPPPPAEPAHVELPRAELSPVGAAPVELAPAEAAQPSEVPRSPGTLAPDTRNVRETATRSSGSGDQVRKRRRQRKRWSRRSTVVGGTLLIAAAAVGGTLFGLEVTDNGSPHVASSPGLPGVATRSSSGGSPPSGGVGPGTVAGVLNIVAAGMPPGWTAGGAPWAWVATPQSDAALAGCLGLPVSHAGIATGATQPGGPRVDSSGWFVSPSGASAFESYVVLTNAPATEESDVAALTGNRAGSCMRGWFASPDQSGDQNVGVPTVSSVAVQAISGERAVGFRAAAVTRIKGAEVQVNEELVVLGAGRVEVALVGESIGEQVMSTVESSQVHGLEHRLGSVTSS